MAEPEDGTVLSGEEVVSCDPEEAEALQPEPSDQSVVEYHNMRDLNGDFYNAILESMEELSSEAQRANAGELFMKINDCLKLHPFLQKRNRKIFARFYRRFHAPIGVDDDLLGMMNQIITNVADAWSLEEMLEWNLMEKVHFLNYAWICKEFGRQSRKRQRVKCSFD